MIKKLINLILLILLNQLIIVHSQFGWELETKLDIYKYDTISSELVSFSVRDEIKLSGTVDLTHLTGATIIKSDLIMTNWFWTVDGVSDTCYKKVRAARFEEFKWNLRKCVEANKCNVPNYAVVNLAAKHIKMVNDYRGEGGVLTALKSAQSKMFKKTWVFIDDDFDILDVLGGKALTMPDIGVAITVPDILPYEEHNTGCRGIVEFKTGTGGAIDTPLPKTKTNLKAITDQFKAFKKVLATAVKGYITVVDPDNTDLIWVIFWPDVVKYNVAKDAQFTYNLQLKEATLKCSDLVMGWTAKVTDLSSNEKTNCERLIMARAAQQISDIDKNSEQPYIKSFPAKGIYDFIHSEFSYVLISTDDVIDKVTRSVELNDAFLTACVKRFKAKKDVAEICTVPYKTRGVKAFSTDASSNKIILVEERACTSSLCKAPFEGTDPDTIYDGFSCIS